ncbi:MAG: hypothetical protein FWD57_12925 [Polyangiaceae bacterium]|nr:hypothetical protein [Polyangiaceae bacterium]
MPKFHKHKAAPKDSRAVFYDEAEEIARAIEGVTAVKRVREEFGLEISHGDGRKMLLHLRSTFNEVQGLSREKRIARVKEFLVDMLEARTHAQESCDLTFDRVRSSLYPVLRGCTHGVFGPSDVRGGQRVSAEAVANAFLIRRPFLPFVDIFVVRDHEKTVEFLNAFHATAWNVTVDDVIDAALETIAKLGKPPMKRLPGGVFGIVSQDDYEPSRLLIPGFLGSFRKKVDGRPIAIMPDRSTVIIGGDGRTETIETMAQFADGVYKTSTRIISPALYTCTDDGQSVSPYHRATGHTKIVVDLGHGLLQHAEYCQQKEVLDKTLRPEEAFVATHSVGRTAEGVFSHASWTKGVETYLPEVDRVSLIVKEDGAEPNALDVPFEAIRSRLTPVPGIRPIRYKTGEFPSDEEIQTMALPGRSVAAVLAEELSNDSSDD